MFIMTFSEGHRHGTISKVIRKVVAKISMAHFPDKINELSIVLRKSKTPGESLKNKLSETGA